MMKIRYSICALSILLAAVMAIAGCESVALMPRPDLDRRNVDRDSERQRDLGRGNVPHDEIVGTVQRVDEGRSEIELRTTEGRRVNIKYEPSTVVFSRGRELHVTDLRYGDLILLQVTRGSSGERYADVIRMNDRPDAGSRRD